MSASTLCPACQSQESTRVETVSAETLAASWAKENCHGDDVGYEAIHQYLLEDLGGKEVEFWQCQDCEMEFAQPMRSWSASHYPIEQHYLGFDHLATLSNLAGMSPVKVLDVGCADGQFLERGAALGHEMVGIDFAVEDVETARSRGLNAQIADVNEIAQIFSGRSKFDVICLFQIIEHLNEPDRIFSQLNEIAAPNSILIVGCPSPLRYTRSFKHSQRVQLSDFWDYPPQHTLRWTATALRVFLRRHGWQVESLMYEPLSIIGAAAHLAGIDTATANTQTKIMRRFKVLILMLRMVGLKFFGRTSGICMLARALRVDDDIHR